MYLYRIHIRPKGGEADMQTTFEYCLKNKFLGVGWPVNSLSNTIDWDQYKREAKKRQDYKLHICAYINKWIKDEDLVWTRDYDGQYYLTQVKSGWEYYRSQESKQKDIDIANIFRCEFQKVEIDMVPGKVVASFSLSNFFESMNSETLQLNSIDRKKIAALVTKLEDALDNLE